MLLIGSRALVSYGFERKPKDWDYIATQTEYDNFSEINKEKIVLVTPKKYGYVVYMQGSDPIEIEIVEKRPSTQVLMDNWETWFPYYSGRGFMASLGLLYALKMSHRFLKNSPHFLKTMRDIKEIEAKGWHECNGIPSHLKDWFKMREKETYDYSHPSLNKKKKDFFVDDFYVYDHDSIHAVVALNELPAFNYFKEDTAEVKCSKEKFFNECSEDVRLAAVYEESAVLALERHQIPNDFRPSPEKSFLISLEKVCTGITSGWFREYAWRNYHKVIDLYHKQGKDKYVTLFKQAIDNGLKPQIQ